MCMLRRLGDIGRTGYKLITRPVYIMSTDWRQSSFAKQLTQLSLAGINHGLFI